MYSAFDIVLKVRVSIMFCSRDPLQSFNSLFISLLTFLPFGLKLYPKADIVCLRLKSFSSSGSSWVLKTNGYAGFCLPMNAATFLFANNINSSINLLESLDDLKKTFSGLFLSSRLKPTSTLSNEIAPLSILSFLNFFAWLFKVIIAS